MSSKPIISVSNLSKKYLISHQQERRYTAMRDVVTGSIKSICKRLIGKNENKNNKEEFWALKDIDFEIQQGDRVGIVGRNGAGKSTLLKILSRITEPTTGKIHLRGRVASLLEVGTGFHPELTGRENIFLNGAIMGMSKLKIKKNFDEIVDFAEVERFLDTPVKRYSSGMYVRLAFAVAAHLEPEILVVDEVLAVGDSSFQEKCIGKMKDVGDEGRTVLFVSHNMGLVRSLCTKAILLEKGKIVANGNIGDVINQYINSGNKIGLDNFDKVLRSGQGDKQITNYCFLDKGGETIENIISGESIKIKISLKNNYGQFNKGRLSINFYDVNKNFLFICTTEQFFSKNINLANELFCKIPKFPLPKGKYFMNFFLEENSIVQDWIKDFIGFEVESGAFHPGRDQYPDGFEGKGVQIDHMWSVKK